MNISMYRDLLDLRNLGTVYKTKKIITVFYCSSFSNLTHSYVTENKRQDLSASPRVCVTPTVVVVVKQLYTYQVYLQILLL